MKLIIDDEEELKEYLISFSFERIINNYSLPFMKNFDLNKKEYDSNNSSKSIINLLKYDREILSSLLKSIQDLELNFSTNVKYFINRKINDLNLNKCENERIFFAIFDRKKSIHLINKLETHLNKKIDLQFVIKWTRFEQLTFGEWIRVFEFLNKELQYKIVGSYKNLIWL